MPLKNICHSKLRLVRLHSRKLTIFSYTAWLNKYEAWYSSRPLIGVIGGRLDHTLGNVSLLLMLDARGKRAKVLDDYSEMEIVSDKPARIEDRYPYFSLLNISGLAQGITIQNAKFPLSNAEIPCEYQYGISNEVLPGMTAEVSVQAGRLLLIKILHH